LTLSKVALGLAATANEGQLSARCPIIYLDLRGVRIITILTKRETDNNIPCWPYLRTVRKI